MIGKIKNKAISKFPRIRKKYHIFLSNRVLKKNYKFDVRDTEETLNILVKTNCSMSRLGDGEFDQFLGGGANYQSHNDKLAKELKEILKSNVPNHIVCVSDAIVRLDERNAENAEYWKRYLRENRFNYYNNMDLKKTYYNTSATRVYKLLEDKEKAGPRFEKWKKIWEDKDIVFIEGKSTRMGIGNDLFSNASSIRRIIGPAENAYDYVDVIFEEAQKIEKNALFILALGPAATVLSYRLAIQGYRALDLGHIDIEYEWYLRNNSTVAIQGKYTNEVIGGDQVIECDDSEYYKQIIFEV